MTNYSQTADEELVELTLLGNSDAYGELVIRHERRVKATAYKVTKNVYSAKDAAQDTFVSAWMNLDSLKSRDRFGSWVCAIAKNCGIRLLTHYASAAADISFELLDDTICSGDDISEIIAAKDDAEHLHRMVDALSEKLREAVNMHYFEGLSVTQIADALSVPVGTVKWRLSEGRKQLRKGYGIMEKTYDENEALVRRVMRQVEQLKLWAMKNDKSGFEADYNAVLSEVKKLQESPQKQSVLADVLMRGYWWLPGEKNKEMLARIKEVAEKSHNEDVMQNIISNENSKYSGQARIDFIKNTQIPYLKENKYVKPLGYALFWLGYEYLISGQTENAFSSFSEVLNVLKPSDAYYANALASLYVEKEAISSGRPRRAQEIKACGEVYRFIGKKLYFWQEPGYGGYVFNSSIFWNSSLCDGLMFDPEMKVGDFIVGSDGKSKLTCTRKNIHTETPAGSFENCTVFRFEGDVYGLKFCETVFCPGVGIVQQSVKRHFDYNVWQLSSYRINGGDGLLPFADGNRWEYTLMGDDAEISDCENFFEVTAFDGEKAVAESVAFIRSHSYNKNSWEGNILQARNRYCTTADKGGCQHLTDVSASLARAEALASTKRQKAHTAAANDVMRRIFQTDPEFNPVYTQKGCRNFFNVYTVSSDEGEITIEGNYKYSFEWKDNCCNELLYNFIYNIINSALGCIWSDKWAVGYEHTYERNHTKAVLTVLEDECAITPAAAFENCRHISYISSGYEGGLGYRNGRMDYWYAEGVGIVKYATMFTEQTPACVYALNSYTGVGEGFFPVADGLIRRYEWQSPTAGWHSSVEYTYDEDESGTVIFRNALGTRDRAEFEANKQ